MGLRVLHVVAVPDTLIFLRGHIRYAKAQGCEVVVASSPGEELDEFAQQEQVKTYGIPIAREINIFRDCVSLFRLFRIIRAVRPDIVHAHTPKAGLLGMLAARMAGVRVAILSQFGLVQITRRGMLKRVLDMTTRVACSLADWVWCISDSNRDLVVQMGLCPARKVDVIGKGSAAGVDAEGIFAPARYTPESRGQLRAHYAIPHDAVIVGYVGRLVGDKGMHELAEAFRVLRDRHPALHLLLVGPFEEKDPMSPEDRELIAVDPRVHLAGFQREIAGYFATMDIFVMPSYREGFCEANIEAAAMELPVVSTRVPGCVDSVQDGVTGTLVPARDAAALAEAIERYIMDVPFRRRHGEAGRVRVLRDFRRETLERELYQHYLRLVKSHQ